MVPEPAREMAQDGEVLGPIHHHGGVRALRRHGAPLPAAAGDYPQKRQGERLRRALATR